MKHSLLLAAFICISLGANAQGIARMRENLAKPDATHGAQALVIYHNSVVEPLQIADRNGRQSKVPCYRIGLFLDNSQSAGAGANACALQFREMFPGVACDVSYASPYFKVVVGHYTDHLDAVAMRGILLAKFPKAVIVKDEISASSVASYTPIRKKTAQIAQIEENSTQNVDF